MNSSVTDMAAGFDKIAISIPGHADAWFVLTCASGDFDSSPADCLAIGGTLILGRSSGDPTISITQEGTESRIRLIETRLYQWAIEGEVNAASVQSPLEEKRRQRWSVRKRHSRLDSGEFCVVNHLGFSSFKLLDESENTLLELPLEFISQKLDFDTEYRRMTEDIAAFCEQLLLNWSAPTSLRFSSDPATERKLLLEQFLFLRHFLNDERLGLLLEAISRHPHSKLIKQTNWKPAGTARSHDYLGNPSRMLRSWRQHGGRKVPGEVLDVHKEDTHDTPPNQFIKFALTRFRQICLEVTELLPSSTSAREATALVNALDALLARRFFREVSPMRRLPLDNQTLQKREGYREILRAWILTQAATTLDWEGNEDCYQGETRDVATLYEYWIFLQMHKILESINGISKLEGESIHSDDPKEFISESDGQITINLSSGEHSRARFLYSPKETPALIIELHYERTFSHKASATSGASYSRQFRPDYTLSIYPAHLLSEKAAEKAGKIAHLHFDAKYRAQKLTEVFGDDEETDLRSEKAENKVLSSYKRGDLLKMHTYNDALRKTIGSYVLYPGGSESKTALRKFHEISPGVGALVMKPGQDACLDVLKGFLCDVFAHQSSQFTQYRYLSDTNHSIVESKPYRSLEEGGETYQIARRNAPCVLMWLKRKASTLFRENGFAYCHAVPKSDAQKLDLDLSIQTGSEFIPCGCGRGQPLTTLGWRAKITGARFLSKEKLRAYIGKRGLSEQLKPSSVEHYILYEFEEVANFRKFNIGEAHRRHRSGSEYMAVTCTWDEILKAQEE